MPGVCPRATIAALLRLRRRGVRRRARGVVTAAVLMTLVGAASATAEQARIIGGTTPSQAWPAQTAITAQRSDGQAQCGGTLVSAYWVLTAAHCVSDADNSVLDEDNVTMRIGGTSTTNGSLRVPTHVVRHPDFGLPPGRPAYDLALLRLSTTAWQQPMRLIASDEALLWAPGTPAKIIGWGLTASGAASPTQLLEANVPMVSDGSCASIWGALFDTASMVCAGGGTTGTCNGDSGGPLMVLRGPYWVTAGITSFGSSPCAQPGVPGVYTRLGAPAIATWVRAYVPTLRISWSPSIPQTGEQVTFTAQPAIPQGQPGIPVIAWDTDADGVYDDGTGTTIRKAFSTDGVFKIGAQASWADGERVFSRDTIRIRPPSSLTASPATFTLTPPQTGTTTIKWSSFVASRVFVSKDGAAETLFASGSSGQKQATVTAPAVYVYRLYEGTADKNVLLKSVTVRGNFAAQSQ